MQKFSIIILFSLIVCNIQAQEKPWMRCTYLLNYTAYLSGQEESYDEMALDIGKKSSAFYSLRAYNYKQYTDSLVATGMEPIQARAKAHEEIDRGSFEEKIYKNIPQKGELTLTKTLINPYLYTVPLEQPAWTLMSEKKEIAGYICKQAQTNFGGRIWNVWYAPDIPISDGPWKLWGLPGLILDAEDTEKHYHFYCVGLKEISDAPTIEIKKAKYVRCTPQEYQKQYKLCYEEPEKYILQTMGMKITVLNQDGNVAKTTTIRKLNYIER